MRSPRQFADATVYKERTADQATAEDGSAVVETTLVLAGLMVLFLAVLQLAFLGLASAYIGGVAADAARTTAATGDAYSAQTRLSDVLKLPFIRTSEVSVSERWDLNLPMVRVEVRAGVPALVPWKRELVVVRHAIIDE